MAYMEKKGEMKKELKVLKSVLKCMSNSMINTKNLPVKQFQKRTR